MSNILTVNYDEVKSLARQFHDDGEDITQLYSNTRQRVHELHDEWVGRAADAFYEEMEMELLPALQRVSGALFLCDEVLIKMMKIIHGADEDTAGFFKEELDFDFGAGKFKDVLGIDHTVDDIPFVLEKEVPNVDQPVDIPPAAEIEKLPSDETLSAEVGASGGGGGGAGGVDSQDMQSDLKGLGAGVGDQTQQVGITNDGQQVIPDHIYGGPEDVGAGTPAQTGPARGSDDHQGQSSIGVAAGIAGAIGAAAIGGGAAKKVLDDQDGQSV